jgi:hypothetical protein
MSDKIRTLEEVLNLLEEQAKMNSYFEIGPDETPLLWAEIQRLRGEKKESLSD